MQIRKDRHPSPSEGGARFTFKSSNTYSAVEWFKFMKIQLVGNDLSDPVTCQIMFMLRNKELLINRLD